jgi:hypothetical protein
MIDDFCGKDGAKKLKAKIEEYWTCRGYDVYVDLIDAGFEPAMRSARTDVRSNMVNGMPPKKNDAKRLPPRTVIWPMRQIASRIHRFR